MTTRQRNALAAAGLASAMMISAPGAALAAGDTQAAWEGYATVAARTAACSTVGGTGVKDTHVSIFRPKINPTDTATFLSFLHTRAALSFENLSEAGVSQMNGAGNYKGYGINSRAKSFTYTAGATYNLTVTPFPVLAGTDVVNITGTINNYFNTAGCNVTFKAVYVKRID